MSFGTLSWNGKGNEMRTSISACGKKLLMFGALMPMMAFAYETETIDGVQWHYSGSSICGVTPCEGDLVIPGTIHGVQMTEIASKAFYGETNLVSVSIPEGVVTIGANAFRGCENLIRVDFPFSLITIGNMAYLGCVSLEDFTLPDSLNSIGVSAFYDCERIGKVLIPDSVEKLGQSAFGCCDNAEIIVGRGLKEIFRISEGIIVGCPRYSKSLYFNCAPPKGWSEFWGSIDGEKPVVGWVSEFDAAWTAWQASLPPPQGTVEIDGVQWNYYGGTIQGATPCQGNLVVPESVAGIPVTAIASKAFYGATNLVSVSIPEGVVSIGAEAFNGCINLREVEFPDSLTTIEDRAFQGCESLEEVILPKELTTIGRFAFLNCVSLRSLILNNKLNAIGINAFYGCVNIGQVILPNSLEKLGQSSFGNCLSAEIVVGRGLKEIDALSWVNFGCDRLSKSIYFNCRPPTGWDRFWSVIDEKPVIAWSHEFDEEWRAMLGLGDRTLVHVLSSELRKNDPTILDVRYIVLSPREKVSVRVLAFEDGVRSVSKILRPETFVADMNGVETAGNVGDNILPNVEHTISWRVSSDWQTKLAKVKFEVLASEGELFPLKFVTIPASDQYGKMKVSVNAISESQLFDALMWLYADRDPGLLCGGGILCSSTNYRDVFVRGSSLDYGGTWVDLHTETEVHAKGAHEYVFGKIKGYSLLNGTLLNYVNSETRLGLSPSGSRQYVYKFVEE